MEAICFKCLLGKHKNHDIAMLEDVKMRQDEEERQSKQGQV